jgi:hypothetical protein
LTTTSAVDLSEEQLGAIDRLLSRMSAEVSGSTGRAAVELRLIGPAGAGKTTCTAEIVRRVSSTGWRVVVLAPTHRAKRVIRQSLRAQGVYPECLTVHAACGLVPVVGEDNARRMAREQAESFDFVIVDEASMLDSHLMSSVRGLASTHSGDHVTLYVGDHRQLPPINSALGIIPAFETEDSSSVAELVTTRRYEPGSPLDVVTAHLRACVDDGSRPRRGILDMLPTEETDDVATEAAAWIEGDDDLAIAWKNETVHGVIRAKLSALHGSTSIMRFRVGDRITLLAPHQYGRHRKMRIHSGTEGVIQRIEDNGARKPHDALVSWDDHGPLRVSLYRASTVPALMKIKREIETLARMKRSVDSAPSQVAAVPGSTWSEKLRVIGEVALARHSFATTVHKSQGSTCRRVAICADDLDAAPRDVCARLWYVAVTRSTSYDGILSVRQR